MVRYLLSSLVTYALKDSSQSGTLNPVASIFARFSAEYVGRGLTGFFAFAKYSAVEIGSTLLPLPFARSNTPARDVRPGLHGAGTRQIIRAVRGVGVKQVEDRIRHVPR